jgi:hypothetical protein
VNVLITSSIRRSIYIFKAVQSVGKDALRLIKRCVQGAYVYPVQLKMVCLFQEVRRIEDVLMHIRGIFGGGQIVSRDDNVLTLFTYSNPEVTTPVQFLQKRRSKTLLFFSLEEIGSIVCTSASRH